MPVLSIASWYFPTQITYQSPSTLRPQLSRSAPDQKKKRKKQANTQTPRTEESRPDVVAIYQVPCQFAVLARKGTHTDLPKSPGDTSLYLGAVERPGEVGIWRLLGTEVRDPPGDYKPQ